MSAEATLETVQRYHPLAKCEQCPLYAEHAYVPTDVREGADTLLVGEAPGADEVRRGQPFVGPSGKLLAHAMMKGGAAKLRASVTNTVGCRPPVRAGKQTKPSKKALDACEPRLQAEVEAVSKVLALGATAGKATTGRAIKVQDDSGAALPARWGEATVTIAPHPALVLRQPGRWPDLVQALQRLTTPRVTVNEPPPYVVYTEGADALDVLEQWSTTGPVIVDVETAAWPQWQGTKPARIRAVGLAPANGPREVAVLAENVLASPRVKEELARLLNSRGIIAHNVKFDRPVLAYHGVHVDEQHVVGDTMLAGHTMDERRGGKGLEPMARRYIGAGTWKPGEAVKADWYNTVDDATLWAYLAQDVGSTVGLRDYQVRTMDARQWDLHDFMLRASHMLSAAEGRGLAFDRAKVRDVIAQHEAALDLALAQLPQVEVTRGKKTATERLNPNSPPQVLVALRARGAKIEATEADVLKMLTGEAGELARQVLTCRDHAKVLGTYLRPLLNVDSADGRVHPTFHLHGTETGRLSCVGPNVQNQPQSVRDVYVARPGYVFVSGDLKGAELRVIAVESGDKDLLDLLRKGRDLHSELAARAFGPNFTKMQRRTAKTVVFGVAYGRTPEGVAKGLGIPLAEAVTLNKTLTSTFPGIGRWQAEIARKVNKGERLSTPHGRERRLPPVMPWMDKGTTQGMVREALAFKPQAIASDINLTAAIKLHSMGVPIVNLVHDNVMAEVPEDRASATAEAMHCASFAAGREYTDLVEMQVEVGISRCWGDV